MQTLYKQPYLRVAINFKIHLHENDSAFSLYDNWFFQMRPLVLCFNWPFTELRLDKSIGKSATV